MRSLTGSLTRGLSLKNGSATRFSCVTVGGVNNPVKSVTPVKNPAGDATMFVGGVVVGVVGVGIRGVTAAVGGLVTLSSYRNCFNP